MIFYFLQCRKFINVVNFRNLKPAIAVRFEDIPFSLPFTKEDITSVIRNYNDRFGVNNYPMYFKGKRNKATVIYLEVYDAITRQKVLASMFSIHLVYVCMYTFPCPQLHIVNILNLKLINNTMNFYKKLVFKSHMLM